MIVFISTSVPISLNYNWYSAIADLHTLQFTVAHALGFSFSTSRLLATDLKAETSTLNHYEILLFASGLVLYSRSTYNAENIFLLLSGADHTENKSRDKYLTKLLTR
jgi:hypothetical protein